MGKAPIWASRGFASNLEISNRQRNSGWGSFYLEAADSESEVFALESKSIDDPRTCFLTQMAHFPNIRVFCACSVSALGEEKPDDSTAVTDQLRKECGFGLSLDWGLALWKDYVKKVEIYTSRNLSFDEDICDSYLGAVEGYQLLADAEFCHCLRFKTRQVFALSLLWGYRQEKNGKGWHSWHDEKALS